MTAHLTRIFNNQITDNTIENVKLKDQTITGVKIAANLFLNSDVTINGQLTITGAYNSQTSINTFINDPLVVFNNGYASSPTYDIGMLINRNLAAASGSNTPYNITGGGYNAAWIWREADGAFEGLLTSELGNTAASISQGAFANLIVGNTIVKTTAGEVVDSVSVSTGAFQVQGGVGIHGNINIGVNNDNWNKIAGNSYFGTTTLTYPSGTPTGQQAVQTIKTFTGTAFNQILVDSSGTYHSSFTQNTAAQNNGLSVVTYQSGNDIRFSPNQIYALSLAAANGTVVVQPTTDSASGYNTGALIVKGGTAINGNLNVQGNASVSGIVIAAVAGTNGKIFIGNTRVSTTTGARSTIIGQTEQTGTVGTDTTLLGYGSAEYGSGNFSTVIGSFAGGSSSNQSGIGAWTTLLGARAGSGLQSTSANNIVIGGGAGSVLTTATNSILIGGYDGQNNTYYPLNLSTGDKNIVISDGTGNIRVWVDTAGTTRITSNTIATHGNPTTGAMAVVGGLSVLGNIQVGGNAITIANGVVFGGNTNGLGGTVYIGGNIRTASLGANTVVVGNYGGLLGSGANVVIIGDNAGTNNPGANSLLIGKHAGDRVPTGATGVTAVGTWSGKTSTGTQNQFFGYSAGAYWDTGAYNVVLGANDGTFFNGQSNTIVIADGFGNARMVFDSTGQANVTSQIQSTDKNTGALVVKGGVGISKDVFVGGQLVVSGGFTVMGSFDYVNSTTIAVTDPIMDLNTGPNGAVLGSSVNFDSGIRTHHWHSGADRTAFFGRADDTGAFEYYAAVTSESGNVIAGTYGNIKAGGAHFANAHNATDKTGIYGRGAITTLGGASIALDTYIGGYTYNSGQTNTGNYVQTTGGTTFNLSGTSTVTINPSTGLQVSTIDNMAIGQTTPANGKFSNLVVSSDGTGYNTTLSGSGTVNIQPTGAVTIGPTARGNMDNMWIGNTTPLAANVTHANVSYSLNLRSFTANSVLFMSPSGNLSVDQQAGNFNYQRNTANTFATVQFSVGTNGDFSGTDTINTYYQGDSYLPNSLISANVLGQTPGWTVATSRGTGVAPTVNSDGDFIGLYGAYAYTGGTPSYNEMGAWKYVVQGSASSLGGQAQLWTKQDGGNQTIALRVDAAQTATFYGQVVIANTTGVSSTINNSTDGSLYVQGVVGISGNVVTNAGMRINDSQVASRDFIVRGPNDATLLWASTKSAYNQVVIGNSATASDLVTGAKLQIWATDSILMPKGAESDRPATPVAGMMRYSTSRGDMEFYNGAGWVGAQSGQAGIWYDVQFHGDDTSTVFDIGKNPSSNSVLVSINGVLQHPGAGNAYVMSGNTLVFSEPPLSSDYVDVRIVSVPYEIRGIASETGNVAFTTEDIAGNVSVYNGARITEQFLPTGAHTYDGLGNATVNTSAVIIDQWNKANYRSAKYYIQVSNNTLGEFETSEVMVIHNSTTAYRTQYNRVYTGTASLGSVTTSVVSGNVVVYYTGVNSGNTVKTRAEYTRV
jgi:hypothetical protein